MAFPLTGYTSKVGAIDALLDILGGIGGMEHLGVEVVHHLPVAVGDGWVTAEHGTLPVPAPATVELLQGIDVRLGGPVEGEAATPTGAALLRVLSSGPPPETCRVQAVGLGAGTRNPKHYPNALRLLVAETASEAAVVQVLATDIDDMTPEYLEPLRSAVFEAGALDCVVWPTQGKKGRVAMRIEAVAPPAVADDVARVLFLHTSTGGIRRTLAQRSTLARREASVELESEIRVRIKVWETPGGRRFKAEFEDVVLAARHLERSPIEIARTAEDLARKRWGNGETENRGEEKE